MAGKMESGFRNFDSLTWQDVYGLYNKALHAKSDKMKPMKKKELINLDEWFQYQLPKAIQKREEKFITHDEICKLMKWKLTRGKFRPRLQQMVESNTEESVISASKKAFKALPDMKQAIDSLTVLKAIGPATASAVLAAGAPEHAAFMADESMLAVPGLGPIQYTLPFYLRYIDEIKSISKKLNKGTKSWTPHKVELTLWTFYILKSVKPELLSSGSPTAAKRKSDEKTETNGNKKKKSS